jgi:tRNA U54 and U55 pseudouridine synthase Pus10
VYGMCKFHASGREDMDVRMLLPHPSLSKVDSSKYIITGRPFVCEVIDAYRLPTVHDLKCVEDEINCERTAALINITDIENDMEWDERGWPHSLVDTNRSYGKNPNGVGVYSLKFVPSHVFSTLQSETENKVKHYGCICWSEKSIDSDVSLCEKLGCSSWNDKYTGTTTILYPMEIQQSTPLRVLHRRSSAIRTRCILTLSARRIDEHWFQLRMSTSAGTYVKEFVHGDCGRTYPSIKTLLGGRVDITELDCEGIVTDA